MIHCIRDGKLNAASTDIVFERVIITTPLSNFVRFSSLAIVYVKPHLHTHLNQKIGDACILNYDVF